MPEPNWFAAGICGSRPSASLCRRFIALLACTPLSLRPSHCCLASKVQSREALLWRKPIRRDRRNISRWLGPGPGLSRIRAAWKPGACNTEGVRGSCASVQAQVQVSSLVDWLFLWEKLLNSLVLCFLTCEVSTGRLD